jgi:uncharacterized membrane protein YfcA
VELTGASSAAGVAELAPGAIALLAIGALLIGVAKTAIGGVSLISVAIFAAVLPSRLSTGVVLPLLLVGDVVAVRTYHAHADWRTLVRLIPAVAVGLAAGVIFIAQVDDTVMRRAIGAVLLALVVLHLIGRRTQRDEQPGGPQSRSVRWGFGSLAGFTTMVANAGGPAMSMYLLAARFTVLSFMGTSAWFFFVVNLMKVPFSVGLELITPATLLLDLVLAPAVVLGAWLGRVIITRIDQALFDKLVLVTTVLSGLNLLR